MEEYAENTAEDTRWCNIGSKANPAKTCVIWSSLNKSIGKADLPNINLNGQTMQRKDRIRYIE